jgi:hypothetical protein
MSMLLLVWINNIHSYIQDSTLQDFSPLPLNDRREDPASMDFTETGCEDGNWTELVQERVQSIS